MSVQKLAGSARLKIEKAPYTMILTDVIQGIKDNDALRLYLCLADKPQNWNVVKSYAEREAGIGQRKAKQCWSYLNRCGLIKYLSHKDDKGKIMRCEMMILNGSEFNAEEPFALNRLLRVPNAGGDLSTGAVVAPVDKPLTKPALSAVPKMTKNQWCGNVPPIKIIRSRSKAKREREGALSDFTPDEQNQEMCREHGLNEAAELESFRHRHKGPKTQYEYKRWLLSAMEYQVRKQNPGYVKNNQTSTFSQTSSYANVDTRSNSFRRDSDIVRIASPQTSDAYLTKIRHMLHGAMDDTSISRCLANGAQR